VASTRYTKRVCKVGKGKMKFLSSVVDEMHKVTWPTLSQNIRDTAIVLTTSLIFALLFGAADWVFEQGITWLSK